MLAYLGKVSFALYLLNFPVYALFHGNQMQVPLKSLGLSENTAGLVLAGIANCVLFAVVICSWHLFEQPILRLKDRVQFGERRPLFVLPTANGD